MTGQPDSGKPSMWRGGLILGVLAAVCTAAVALTHRLTEPRIEANAVAYLEQSLRPVLADLPYNSDLSASRLVIEPPHELPGNEPVTVYRAFNEDQPVAALFVVTARGGFTGPIELLVGILYSGEISKVRVLEHRETPGLGDLIEASKSDWIEQFSGTSLGDPARENWAIRRDGGEFDQLTGASITPRAVIKAVKETLLYFEANRDRIFSTEDAGQPQESP